MIRGGPLDDVDVEDFANGGEEIDDLFLVGVGGEVADKDRTTVHIILAEELLVGVGARDEVLLLHVEGIDAVSVVLADGLWEIVSMQRTRSDVAPGSLRLTVLRSRLGSNLANSTRTEVGRLMASHIWALSSSHLLSSPYGSKISRAVSMVTSSPRRL